MAAGKEGCRGNDIEIFGVPTPRIWEQRRYLALEQPKSGGKSAFRSPRLADTLTPGHLFSPARWAGPVAPRTGRTDRLAFF